VNAKYALDLLRDAGAAVPAHDLRIGARSQALLSIEAPDQWLLGEYVLRAPEPVGVPAPDVVVHREVVLALLGDRAVVDALVGVVARIGCRVGEAAEGDVHLARREHGAVDEVGLARAQPLAERMEELVRRLEAD